MVPVISLDHAPTTEGHKVAAHSGSVPKQLGSAGDRRLDTLPTVSDNASAVVTIVVTN